MGNECHASTCLIPKWCFVSFNFKRFDANSISDNSREIGSAKDCCIYVLEITEYVIYQMCRPHGRLRGCMDVWYLGGPILRQISSVIPKMKPLTCQNLKYLFFCLISWERAFAFSCNYKTSAPLISDQSSFMRTENPYWALFGVTYTVEAGIMNS